MRRLVYVALLVLAACGDDPKSSVDTADTGTPDSADGTGPDTPDADSDAAEAIAPDAPDVPDTIDTAESGDAVDATDLPDTTEQSDVTADGDDSDDGDVASDATDTSPPAPAILRRAVRSVAGFGAPDGPIAEASIGRPQSLATLGDGSLVFADGSYQTLRRVDDQGVVSTIAGSGSVGGIGDGGPATEAQLAIIYGGEMVVDDDGLIYLSDFENHRVRVINPTAGGLRACGGVEVAAGAIETVAGSGEMGFGGEGSPAVSALLEYPRGITFWNGDLVFADIHNCRIRRVRCADGIIETVAGNGGWPYYNEDGTVTVYWREGEPTEAADFGDGPDAREAFDRIALDARGRAGRRTARRRVGAGRSRVRLRDASDASAPRAPSRRSPAGRSRVMATATRARSAPASAATSRAWSSTCTTTCSSPSRAASSAVSIPSGRS